MKQHILKKVTDLAGELQRLGCCKLLLVCGSAYPFLNISEQIEALHVPYVKFSDFKPNPQYESIVMGVRTFNKNSCDAIFAVGGGSAIDVAKCIKLYANMNPNANLLRQRVLTNDIPLIAFPTTAGTGSEVTKYAVIYYNGQKQSITNESIIPSTVILDPVVLKALPIYQRKATMMDALCHAIESFWSINSTDESRKYSRKAIQGVLANMDGYLGNTEEGNEGMLIAAHTAGKAINITQTTAGHAMCYKITSLFGYAHGHAAILCDRILYPWMIENMDKCIDPRGRKYLGQILNEIGQALGCENAEAGAVKLERIFIDLNLAIPELTEEQYQELRTSVNPARLKNHPIALDEETIDKLYHKISI